MDCQGCGKGKAVVFFKEANKDTLGLCKECAAAKGVRIEIRGPVGITPESGPKGVQSTAPVAASEPSCCGFCGLHVEMLRRHGRLGCPECYTDFGPQLEEMMKAAQGALHHVGKVYVPPDKEVGGDVARRSILARRLERAIELEDYELAAQLRDEIQSTEVKASVGVLRTHPAIEEQGLGWMDGDGPKTDIVVSSRVRIARNIQGYAFPTKLGARDREMLLEVARTAMDRPGALGDADFWDLPELGETDRTLLLERRLVSRELVRVPKGNSPPGTGLIAGRDRPLAIMINEEDHLRLHTIRPGLQLTEAWRALDQLDEELGARLPYAYDNRFGFLTSCPTNVGTGLRSSVFIHLPGLVLTKHIRRVLDGIREIGFTYRGLYGEGSKIIGNFFQVSNQVTLGKSEQDLIESLEQLVHRIIGYEQQARSYLMRNAERVLLDKVWRAYGLLRHARYLPFEEAMNLLSGLRLGASLRLLDSPRVLDVNQIMIGAQAAHLEVLAGRTLNEKDANVFRADYVRRVMTDLEEPAAGKGALRPE